MKKTDYQYILHIVSRNNVLPVTSNCNLDCVFCSHRQNPPGLEVFLLPRLTLDDYNELIEYLDPSRKIVIGESSTRIIEGEPFCHKNIMKVIEMARQRHPHTPLLITTNGCFLDRKKIKQLAEVMPLEMNISINLLGAALRRRLLGDMTGKSMADTVELLAQYGIPFNGSVVALDFPGWDKEFDDIIKLLEETGARTLRVMHPGYSTLCHDDRVKPDYVELSRLIDRKREEYSIPILLEPPHITDFQAVVEGVVRNSPAHTAGIMKGDVITDVNGRAVLSRVDAFNRILSASRPDIRILRKGRYFSVTLDKSKGIASGLVLKYDLDPWYMEQAVKAVNRNRSVTPLFVTSGMAFDRIRRYLGRYCNAEDIEVIRVKNNFFGGNIDCAGLMVAEDIINAVGQAEKCMDRDLILLPSIAFDYRGRDLTGKSYTYIQDIFDIKVEIV